MTRLLEGPPGPPWPQLGPAGLFAQWAASQPEAPWLLRADGSALSWGEAQRAAEGLAWLWALKPGQVVALALPQGEGLALALWACWRVGALPHRLPPELPGPALAERLAALGPARVLEALPEGPWADGAKGELPPPPGPEALALMVASSGSSGEPSLVAWSGAGMLWNALAHAQALGLKAGDRVLASGPWSAAFPMVAELICPWALGGAAVLPPGPFAPRAWLAHAQACGVAHLALPPPQFDLAMALVRQPQGLPRVLSTGAMPLPGPKLLAMATWAEAGGARFAYTYGLSEAGPRVATAWGEGLRSDPEGALLPLPGVALALRPEAEAPPEAGGLIWVRSPSCAAALWQQGALAPWPEASRDGGPELPPGGQAGPKGAWLGTGDWGAWGPDGALRVVGRQKATILVGGASVGAEGVEKALLAHPLVKAACVVAHPHPSYGEVPWAYVEAEAGYDADAAPAALLGMLPREALPQRVLVVQALPRLANGKVDRMAVKAWGEAR